ncbi:non-canonical purine NTP pyrophosphatase [Arthrobacter sp. H14-L1]|uniref:non-canonical purine NTP pyrophosphatase n=1 Tax=Arthrobacter sp. H14-L1 TaxID=2996697 RepID=UPI002271A26B|nr:non-canonical purine NTP pyrophosphatase [Arthrobacter sp. H14-L1]MCY0905383.1 non-canonical purine NTP pyrophosphatase [Arthrobacter sp. H14-L1]
MAAVKPRLVLATHNKGKLREFRELLRGQIPGLDVDTQVIDAAAAGAPDVAETGVTFAENSLLKARTVAAATGLVAVADDSGLAVDVLGGAPGIFSARWSGRHGDDDANTALLLAQLADIDDAHRAARFVCAAAVAVPGTVSGTAFGPAAGPASGTAAGADGVAAPAAFGLRAAEHVEHGELPGVLLRAPRGDGGFGYDPILVPDGLCVSCAELAPDDKNAISHRGQAFRKLLPYIIAALERN